MPTEPADPVGAAMEAELRLLDPAVRVSPQQLAELLHPDFCGIGASGRTWNRDTVTAALTTRLESAQRPVTASHMRGVRLAPDVVHLTFDTESGAQRTHRSSLWRLTEGRWLLYFHQGTHFGARADAG
ncbi:nuclear transport factor 2 family protein [Streptomyces sp. HNM0663]|uniref:Nuclear transport factor 2 family protein n=1 Tax=Streptomyces chengmaiensis TaxID=3040919 RepID=A0ABT6HR20_9ACTN|nr:nuclear transport factor 2 family protein [Streptomyces chengmaiensis]MDH2391055.1 nuclear transport factor 2 family protein [Streptomyces chengmaiensis]